jgi:hypothetical protein
LTHHQFPLELVTEEANRRSNVASTSKINALNAAADQLGGIPGVKRTWNGTAKIGTIYKLQSSDPTRVGNCWAKGRLKEGDHLLCVAKSGDCFYDYVLLETTDYSNRPGVDIRPVSSKLGAYQIGMPVTHLDDDEFDNLMAGQKITTDFKW